MAGGRGVPARRRGGGCAGLRGGRRRRTGGSRRGCRGGQWVERGQGQVARRRRRRFGGAAVRRRQRPGPQATRHEDGCPTHDPRRPASRTSVTAHAFHCLPVRRRSQAVGRRPGGPACCPRRPCGGVVQGRGRSAGPSPSGRKSDPGAAGRSAPAGGRAAPGSQERPSRGRRPESAAASAGLTGAVVFARRHGAPNSRHGRPVERQHGRPVCRSAGRAVRGGAGREEGMPSGRSEPSFPDASQEPLPCRAPRDVSPSGAYTARIPALHRSPVPPP